jgi:hypothetical protein
MEVVQFREASGCVLAALRIKGLASEAGTLSSSSTDPTFPLVRPRSIP